VVIDVLPARESEVAAKTRNDKQAWLIERGYRVLAIDASMIESDLPQVLDGLAASIAGRP
jgi:very-short-patch-repair endonuclease